MPEGGVYACVSSQTEFIALKEQAASLPELLRPAVLTAQLNQLPSLLTKQAPDLRFDCIIGRNALSSETDKVGVVQKLIPWLSTDGILVLAETVPRYTQRLYDLLQPTCWPLGLLERLKIAESAIYEDNCHPMVNWDALELKRDLEQAGLTVQVELEQSHTSILITPALVERWFATTQSSPRLTYRQHLERMLTIDEVNLVKQLFSQYLSSKTVDWSSTTAYFQVS